jgi:hypothetical protein
MDKEFPHILTTFGRPWKAVYLNLPGLPKSL